MSDPASEPKPAVGADFLASAAGLWLDAISRTTRWTVEGREHVAAIETDPRGYLVAFWHERLLLAPAFRRHSPRRAAMLVSRGRDGAFIARAVARFDIDCIRGSAANPKKPDRDKGGGAALFEMVAALRTGAAVGVTPDGPRGPRRRAHAGVVKLAGAARAPIVPIAASTSAGWRLGSWDRMLAPLPFGRGAIVAGEPLAPPASLGPDAVEAARRALEAALDAATARADGLVGRSPDPTRIG